MPDAEFIDYLSNLLDCLDRTTRREELERVDQELQNLRLTVQSALDAGNQYNEDISMAKDLQIEEFFESIENLTKSHQVIGCNPGSNNNQ